jgi:hypothetical protein
MMFCLIAATTLVKPSELYRMKPALEANARHLSQAYMLDDDPIAIEVIDRESALPKGCNPVVFVDDGADSATLAQHWFDPLRDVPAARVMVQNTSGLNAGSYSACEAACHEILEARMNRKVATWMDHPRRGGIQVAYEVADPTQDHYSVRVGNTDWQVANFVTPFWWMRTLPLDLATIERDFGYGVDWCKRLRHQGEIGPEGYAVLRERTSPNGRWRQWSEGSNGPIGQNSRQLAHKQHLASRTQKLLRGAI